MNEEVLPTQHDIRGKVRDTSWSGIDQTS